VCARPSSHSVNDAAMCYGQLKKDHKITGRVNWHCNDPPSTWGRAYYVPHNRRFTWGIELQIWAPIIQEVESCQIVFIQSKKNKTQAFWVITTPSDP
jgi:hypothetical protein